MSAAGARRWLVLANEDLAMAEYAVSSGIFRQACFHAQQAVEKALKGFLVARVGTHAKSHSLEQLLVSDPQVHDELQAWRARLRRLDGFYLPTRYADAIPLEAGEPTRDEAQGSLDDARAIVSEITAKIGGGA
jgi:HEPN domain-containing protein